MLVEKVCMAKAKAKEVWVYMARATSPAAAECTAKIQPVQLFEEKVPSI